MRTYRSDSKLSELKHRKLYASAHPKTSTYLFENIKIKKGHGIRTGTIQKKNQFIRVQDTRSELQTYEKVF